MGNGDIAFPTRHLFACVIVYKLMPSPPMRTRTHKIYTIGLFLRGGLLKVKEKKQPTEKGWLWLFRSRIAVNGGHADNGIRTHHGERDRGRGRGPAPPLAAIA